MSLVFNGPRLVAVAVVPDCRFVAHNLKPISFNSFIMTTCAEIMGDTRSTFVMPCRRCCTPKRQLKEPGVMFVRGGRKSKPLNLCPWSRLSMLALLFFGNLCNNSRRNNYHLLAASAFQPTISARRCSRLVVNPKRGYHLLSQLSNSGSSRPALSALASNSNQVNAENSGPLHSFQQVLSDRNVEDAVCQRICSLLNDAGFMTSSELVLFAADFEQSKSPESLSRILQSDFGFSAYLSHICRAALFDLVRKDRKSSKSDTDGESATDSPSLSDLVAGSSPLSSDEGPKKDKSKSDERYWNCVVNVKQQQRLSGADYQYALPKHYERIFPTIAKEIEEEFLTFMTQPTASSQEPPIRKATAVVYQRHARQFAGWFLKNAENTEELNMDGIRGASALGEEEREKDKTVLKQCKAFSIHSIIPSKDATSAQPIVEYVIWLRKVRNISNNYEANLLRGLTKLLKFRFASESKADPTYGERSFHDIPVVRELRRLQRDASRRQTKSSERSSDEKKKWLSWSEYLDVVDALKKDVADELEQLVRLREESKHAGGMPPNDVGRRIGKKYQRYLLLAFFSSLPDRQRTMRELEIGRTFLRNDETNTWVVKHGHEDYKTGNTYGDRPPLGLSPALTSSIDDYLKYWRPYLKPSSDHFFVGSTTGKPLTVESVRYLVSKACYEHAGKKTNPHLLRDMIVTHVRDSPDVSERDLEALALFMGHSVQMQRSSYDRRTLDQKVAPAVELLQNINSRP